MKICMTHYAFFPITGGVESHLLDLCSELVIQGHEVYALVGSLEGSPEQEEINGIKIYRSDLMNPFYIREYKEKYGYKPEDIWPKMIRKLKEFYSDFVNKYKIDVVHGHNFHHFLPGHSLALTELHREGLPTVLTIHEVWSEFICEDLLQKSEWDKIITVSKHVQEGILEQAPHLNNIRLIYHGIDTTLFSPENSESEWAEKLELDKRPVIIHPARMLPWKGVIYSIRAMDVVRNVFPEAILIITDTEEIVDWVGELPGYKQKVLREIKELGLLKNVVIQSFPYLDLPGVYNHCDVVIYPTIGEEPFGLVPVEAMACAKPVIVTKSGGLVESVIDNETGFIIDKKNPEQLAEKIILLLKDKKLAKKMGLAGRKRAVEVFSRKRMAEEVIEVYEESIKKHKK